MNKREQDGFLIRGLLGLLALALLMVTPGCGRKDTAAPVRPPSPVTVVTAQAADVPVMLDTFGRLRAAAEVDIRPQVSGKIVEAPFDEGARVKKGAVLFRIESDIYQAAVDQAAAKAAEAEAELVKKQATLDRNRQLLAQSLVSQEDFDNLATSLDAAQAQVDQARAALAQNQVDLQRCVITSPVEGYTGRRLVDVGNVVAASGSQALVNVRSLDELYLDFTISETQLPQVRQAMAAGKVEVLLLAESPTGEHGMHQGELRLIDNTIDVKSGTVLLRALVDNRDAKLWPGQFAYVFPILRTLKQAVIVPLAAVAMGKNGPYAFVVKDGQAELRELEQGAVVGDAVVIEKGIAAGDVVVTSGQMGVWPGAALQIKTKPDDATQAQIQRRLNNPNVTSLIRILAARGETADQIALIVGIPAGHLHEFIEEGQAQ